MRRVMYEVRKFNPELGLPTWRADAYDVVVATFKTIAAAHKLAAKLGPDHWVVAVSPKEGKQA